MKTLLTVLLMIFTAVGYSQTINNMTLVGSKNEYTSGGTPSGWHYSSCWGYTDLNGREYAMIGFYGGTAFYDITDAPTITNVGMIPGPGSFYNYRNIKTYSHYAYMVSEGGDGLQIVDLQYLPDSVHFVKSYYYTGFTKAHTLSQNGHYLYLNGGNNNPAGGVTILDITDPENPVKRGTWSTRYVHDCYVRNDTIYAACINSGYLSILNATNPDNITLISEFTYPQPVTHNAWLSADGNYLAITNEGGSNHTFLWDVTNKTNAIQLSEIIPYENSMVHNAIIKGDSLYMAHYRGGIIVCDISNKSAPVEVGHYDTYPGSGTAYQGAWMVYPFFSSGKIIGSDIATGLYVLKMGTSTNITNNNGMNPDEYSLSQNYPNPFNPMTRIDFNIPKSGLVTVKVYDNTGREVATLLNEDRSSGAYSVYFDGASFSSGVYFYSIKTDGFTDTKKMLLVK